MKKNVIILSLLIFAGSLWAQSTGLASANKKTAQRCLQLAENCMIGQDWKNALGQAELGLAYDETISDLIYVKAAAQNKLGEPRATVIKTIAKAFDENNWVNYNLNNARILYADLLCDTGMYDKSLELLNSNPFIYSADAEFIRIKDYYRLGTADSITQARTKINSARKIYPQDTRFPELFFVFEMMFMNYAERNGITYEIPDSVQTIADSYIVHFPDYKNPDLSVIEMEIMALLFAKGEAQTRLLRAIGEQNQDSPLFAYTGLRSGILSEEKAYNLFFEKSNGSYYLSILESFVPLIKNPGLVENLTQRLNAFNGTLYIDEDLDFRNELVVQYDRGRPLYISYDKNNDQIIDLYAVCDFGVPMQLSFDAGRLILNYDIYPAVKKVELVETHQIFHFLNDDLCFTPFDIQLDKTFTNLNCSFFVPYLDSEYSVPDEYILAQRSSCVEMPTAERFGSSVIYTVFAGRPVFATFQTNNVKFAFATIEPGLPFVRYADYDNDGVFETAETFDIDRENQYTSEEEIALIKKIFGENTFSSNLYLKKVEVDRNSDTVVEYKEEFLGNGGKLSAWDNDNNGIWDYEYILYPREEGNAKIEEVLFYDQNGLPSIILKSEDGIPKVITTSYEEVELVPGKKENVYWLGESGTPEQENKLLKKCPSDMENGAISLFEISEKDDETDPAKKQRISIIKIDGNYFCKLVPASESVEDEKK